MTVWRPTQRSTTTGSWVDGRTASGKGGGISETGLQIDRRSRLVFSLKELDATMLQTKGSPSGIYPLLFHYVLGNLHHAQSFSRFAHVGRLDCDECAEAARAGAQGMQRGHVDARFRQFAHHLGHCAGTVFAVYQERLLLLAQGEGGFPGKRRR